MKRKRKIFLTDRQLIVIMVALKELETSIETQLPCITCISKENEELDILLNNIILLEDSKELQADFCHLISSQK